MVYQGKTLGSASLPPIISSRGESDSGGMLKQVTATLLAQLILMKCFAVFGASSDAKTQMLTILCYLWTLFSVFQSMPSLSLSLLCYPVMLFPSFPHSHSLSGSNLWLASTQLSSFATSSPVLISSW